VVRLNGRMDNFGLMREREFSSMWCDLALLLSLAAAYGKVSIPLDLIPIGLL
jgi:hypothetical protein